MKLLLLGGGVFLGAATLDAALARGHAVTVFNRGRARQHWPAGVEVLTGDRGGDLSGLSKRRWDAVIDCCGYTPAELRRSADALAASDRYLFVSSVSAYASTGHAPLLETDALASRAGIARDDRDIQHYGAQKGAAEAEVVQVFGERALLVRPGLIVGPGDTTGRFGHWAWRMLDGGTMLVPDVPAGEPLQFIDVRDLGAWMVALVEQPGASGPYNATGPVGTGCDWPTLIAGCAAEAAARGIAPPQVVRVAESFLGEQQVRPWTELPLWLPSDDPEFRGFSRVALGRAVATGLRTRPLRETIAAVMDEGLPAPDDKRRANRLTRAREAELLALWAKRAP